MAKAKGKGSKKRTCGRQATPPPPSITFAPETITGYRKLAKDVKQAMAEGERHAQASEELQRLNDIRDGLLPPRWMKNPAAVSNTPAAQLALKNPRGAGRKREFDYEFILIEAAVHVVTNGLPKSVEELVHDLQNKFKAEMPEDTQAKKILGRFFQRMKQELGR